MCKYGFNECEKTSKELFDNWLQSQTKLEFKEILYFLENTLFFKSLFLRIPNDFKNIVFQTAIRTGDKSDWFNLYEKAINESNNSERLRMIKGLCSTQDENLLKL